MKLGHTIIYVNDVPATMDFYERVFGIPKKFLHESNAYGEMETGTTVLSFLNHARATEFTGTSSSNSLEKDPNAFEITFIADNAPAAYEKAVAAGATPHRAPQQTPWGQIVSYVRDLNGVLVEICSHIPK